MHKRDQKCKNLRNNKVWQCHTNQPEKTTAETRKVKLTFFPCLSISITALFAKYSPYKNPCWTQFSNYRF